MHGVKSNFNPQFSVNKKIESLTRRQERILTIPANYLFSKCSAINLCSLERHHRWQNKNKHARRTNIQLSQHFKQIIERKGRDKSHSKRAKKFHVMIRINSTNAKKEKYMKTRWVSDRDNGIARERDEEEKQQRGREREREPHMNTMQYADR